MDVFSQEIFLLLLPFLLILVIGFGAISLVLKPIPLTEPIREMIQKLAKKIRDFLLIRFPKIKIGSDHDSSDNDS